MLDLILCTKQDATKWWEVVSSIGGIILGVGVGFISYQQWLLNKNKAKFELYEKRYEAFRVFNKFLGGVKQNGAVASDDMISLKWKFEEHYFLFDDEIHAYVQEIYDAALESRRLARKITKTTDANLKKSTIEKQDKKIEWLINQIAISKKKFEKYLRIK